MCSPFVFALHVLDARVESESDVQSAELSCDWSAESAPGLYRGTGRRDLARLPKIAPLT